VEYADAKVLIDVGLRNFSSDNNDKSSCSNETSMGNEDTSSSHSFWESLPPHDCLLLTDSTMESLGCLPLYVKGMQRAFRKRRKVSKNEIAAASTVQRCGPTHNIRKDENTLTITEEDLVLPIYATFPTVKMGQMSLYDHHANLSLDGGSPPYTLEEMDVAISMLRTIKYSQTLTLPLAKKGETIIPSPSLSIVAHRAGHVVGGAFYKFQRIRDETTVVFTGNAYHIAKELHLDACTLLQNGMGADVLVTRPGGQAFPLVNGLYSSSTSSSSSSSNEIKEEKKKKKMIISPLASKARRDLTERVLGFLRRDANVMLPVDASGRALELVLLFNMFWSKQNLSGSYNLVWFGSMVYNTLEFSRSQLEWMNPTLGNNIFDSSRNKKVGDNGQHPYSLKQISLCTNMAELDKIMAESNDKPTCVLANGLTLDHGPARDLFLRWADNDNNAIIFTDSSQCLKREKNIMSGRVGSASNNNSSTGDVTDQGSNSDPSSTSIEVKGGNQPPTQGVATAETEGCVDHSIEDDLMGIAIAEDEASPYTTSYQLLKYWSLAKAEDREMDDILTVDVFVPRRKPLVGNELAVFLAKEEATRVAQRKLEEKQAMLREVELAKGRLRLGEDAVTNTSFGRGGTSSRGICSTAEIGHFSSASNAAHLPFFRPKKKSRFDSSLFLKFSKPLHLTFELREDAVGVGQRDVTTRFGIGESVENSEVLEDDYGIAIVHDQFRDIVTGVDPSKFGAQKDEINKRGLSFSSSADGSGGGKNSAMKSDKKHSRDKILGLGGNDDSGVVNDDEDDIDERGVEAIDLSDGHGIIRGRNGRPPIKVTIVNRRIEVMTEIDYIPLEGRVESRAARQSVQALRPRHVVVLGGTKSDGGNYDDNDEKNVEVMVDKESRVLSSFKDVLLGDEVRALADAAKSFVVDKQDPVFMPSDFHTVELRVGHHAYPARIIATPFRTKEERLAEEEVPHPIELIETKIGNCTVSMLDFVMTGQKVAVDGSIVIAPKNTQLKTALSSTQPSILEQELQRPPVYVSDGEVLLTELKTELNAQHGMKAEYSARSGYSQLVVNGRIIIKKWVLASDETAPGEIDVEGPLCEDFFTVRSVVCNQYVTL